MARTTSTLVSAIVEVDSTISLEPFIKAAAILIDKVAAKGELAAATLKVIETWLAAHFYCMRDPRAVSERAGPVGATYQSAVSLNLATSHYGQMAMVLDTTGTLRSLSNGKVTPKLTWVGTPYD